MVRANQERRTRDNELKRIVDARRGQPSATMTRVAMQVPNGFCTNVTAQRGNAARAAANREVVLTLLHDRARLTTRANLICVYLGAVADAVIGMANRNR